MKKTKRRRLETVRASLEKQDIKYLKCLWHNDEQLKYVCTLCSELVAGHDFSGPATLFEAKTPYSNAFPIPYRTSIIYDYSIPR